LWLWMGLVTVVVYAVSYSLVPSSVVCFLSVEFHQRSLRSKPPNEKKYHPKKAFTGFAKRLAT
jgi:hypothetical protein